MEFLTKRGQLRNQKEISLIFSQNKKRPDPYYTRDQDIFSITDYSATGYTLTCFLSRPLRSNLTTPATLANNVLSPPIPTLTPG